jgi:hypothetical protein
MSVQHVRPMKTITVTVGPLPQPPALLLPPFIEPVPPLPDHLTADLRWTIGHGVPTIDQVATLEEVLEVVGDYLDTYEQERW